ncbi:integrase core domain-containing protein [Streptomyces sp. TLI_171]|uniref:integrase core domain-containing protein n=1 Tax=Streptomyces sp. TLI_171 TaxID=1938859 RepID=UPI000C19C9AB
MSSARSTTCFDLPHERPPRRVDNYRSVNALAEALNGTAELIEHQGPWRDFDEVERALFQWVAWYNGERLHSALDYVSPDEYEQAYWASPESFPQTA